MDSKMSGPNGKFHIIMSALQLLFMSLRTSKQCLSIRLKFLFRTSSYSSFCYFTNSRITSIKSLTTVLHWVMSRKWRGEVVHLCFSWHINYNHVISAGASFQVILL